MKLIVALFAWQHRWVDDGLLQNRLGVGLLAALLVSPVALIATHSYWSTSSELTASELSRRQAVVNLAAATLEEKLNRLNDLGISLATRVRFRQLVIAGKAQEAIKILEAVPRDFPFIERVSMADANGTLTADSPQLSGVIGTSRAQFDWYRGVTATRKPYISEVYRRVAKPQYYIIAQATPITNANGDMVAILVLQVRTETFLKWIQSIETGARGYLFIVDRRGSTVAHSRWTANTESVDYSNVVAVKDVLQGKNGVAVGVSVGSEADQVVAYGPISGFGWGVVFQESLASAFALRDNSLTRLRNAYFLLAVGVCVAGYLLLRVLRARRRGDKKFHDLVESAPDGLVMADESGKIVLVNAQAEKIFGYTRHELIGHTVELLMPERFRMHHPKHRQEFLYSGKPRSMGLILQGLRKDGSEFPIDVSLSPVEAEGRRLVISAIRDITERVRLQDQLQAKNEELAAKNHMVERANRLKSEFLANMSHELRTPLNGIIGFAELMHDGKVGPIADNHKEYLADILTSAKHLLGLINDVLDLSKVEAGKMEFRPEPIRLTKIASEVVEILRAAASSKRIQVETDIAAAVDDVVIDPAKLKQVLYNYLSNALKFTGDNGEIWLRAKADGPNNFRLEVEDNGIGIAAEHLNKLFIEFQQLDSSVRKKHQGTGLGLALGAAGVKGIQSGVDPYGCAAAGH